MRSETINGRGEEPYLSNNAADEGAKGELFGPLGGVVVIFVKKCDEILHVKPWLSVSVIGHTTSMTPRHWLEVSATAHGRIMLVSFLEVVLGSPGLIGIPRVWHGILYCIRVHIY